MAILKKLVCNLLRIISRIAPLTALDKMACKNCGVKFIDSMGKCRNLEDCSADPDPLNLN